METTQWKDYGRASGNTDCQDCMVHCGYEPSAVSQTFSSWSGFWETARLTMFGPGRGRTRKPTATPGNAAPAQPKPAGVLYDLELPVGSQ